MRPDRWSGTSPIAPKKQNGRQTYGGHKRLDTSCMIELITFLLDNPGHPRVVHFEVNDICQGRTHAYTCGTHWLKPVDQSPLFQWQRQRQEHIQKHYTLRDAVIGGNPDALGTVCFICSNFLH